MKFVSVHFDAISDLMMDLTLAADVNSDLGNIVRLLTAIRCLEDPINQSHDREELKRSLQELSSDAPERLNDQLLRIAHEVPQMEEEEGRG